MALYGYIRVSTKEQNDDRQVIALKEEGVPDENIYRDKMSGKNFERPKYKRLLETISEGDVLFIKSIDRLGRNYEEILEQWALITKEKKIQIVVIDMPLLDTRTRAKNDLVSNLIADVVLQILSFVAENERMNIRQRQAEGIAAAKRKGVRFGRPKKEVPEKFTEAVEKWQRGELSMRAAARFCGMPASTFGIKAKALVNRSKNV